MCGSGFLWRTRTFVVAGADEIREQASRLLYGRRKNKFFLATLTQDFGSTYRSHPDWSCFSSPTRGEFPPTGRQKTGCRSATSSQFDDRDLEPPGSEHDARPAGWRPGSITRIPTAGIGCEQTEDGSVRPTTNALTHRSKEGHGGHLRSNLAHVVASDSR